MMDGKLLQMLRCIRGEKQNNIAKALGIEQSAYSDLEQSKEISAEREQQILAFLKFTKEEAEELEKFLPPPPR